MQYLLLIVKSDGKSKLLVFVKHVETPDRAILSTCQEG